MKGSYLYEEPEANWDCVSLKKIFDFTKNNQKYCDAVLIPEEEKSFFRIHRAILASRIVFFEELFDKNPDDDKFKLKISKEALEQVISLCYEGCLSISISNVCFLIEATCLFEMKKLFNTCIKFIKANLNSENALIFEKYLQNLTYTSNEIKNLQHRITRFIFKNFLKVIMTQSFLELDNQRLIKLLKINQLNIEQEEQVYDALMSWLNHDINSRSQFIDDLIKLIRFQHVDIDFLVKIAKNESTIKNQAREYLLQILKQRTENYSNEHLNTKKTKRSFISDPTGHLYVCKISAYCLENISKKHKMIERYEPEKDRWSEIRSENKDVVACLIINDNLYNLIRHDHSRYSLVMFDPICRSWRLPVMEGNISDGMPSIAVLDDEIYFCGGADSGKISNKVIKWNTTDNSKNTEISPMKNKRFESCAIEYEGWIFVAGGRDSHESLNSIECYNSKSNQWNELTSMNSKRFKFQLAKLDGLIYAAGGFTEINNTECTNTVEKYDLIQNDWQYIASMNQKRYQFSLASCNSLLYAIAGYDGKISLNSVEFYSPNTNQWTFCTEMNFNSGFCSSIVLPVNGKWNLLENDE